MKKKKMYKITLAMGATLMSMAWPGAALAFHGGGIGQCDGCHYMHNPADEAPAVPLMKGSDASSTCLACHDGSNGCRTASIDGTTVSQGGDFFWVSPQGTYDYALRGVRTAHPAERHGHNIVAADFGFTADFSHPTSPGGSVASTTLGCTSCHDPHGQVDGGTSIGAAAISVSGSYGAPPPTDGTIRGNFRLLGDAGFKDIVADAPVATSKDGSVSTSCGLWTNYGDGMSDWCLSCHPGFANGAAMHPVDVPVPELYNSYKKGGDFSGNVSTAFDALVPFERGISEGSDPALVADSSQGADGRAKVMCLTCHRAHASAFDNALRWDGYTSKYLAESAVFQAIRGFSYIDKTDPLHPVVVSIPPQIPSAIPYYKAGAPVDVVAEYGPYQRSLCNKCHAKD